MPLSPLCLRDLVVTTISHCWVISHLVTSLGKSSYVLYLHTYVLLGGESFIGNIKYSDIVFRKESLEKLHLFLCCLGSAISE